MGRGGVREGAGRRKLWNSPGDTVTVRVPRVLAKRVKDFAIELDERLARASTGRPVNPATFSATQLSLKIKEDPSPLFSETEFLDMARQVGVEGLYYITHIANLRSILSEGILSHRMIESRGLEHEAIYNPAVINLREGKEIFPGQDLWGFANLYFQPRNPMMYSVVRKFGISEVAIIGVKPTILNRRDVFISTGNAASVATEFHKASDSKKLLGKIAKQVDIEWWNNDDGTKRKIMAECLVPNLVKSDYIQSIYVANPKAKDKVKRLLSSDYPSLPIVQQSNKFFEPHHALRITPTLSLVRGDMFFSRMQTLTISVNCVGVMGKGLASTAKDRFPDVYVHYENLCKRKQLKLGKPCLHKRESSVIDNLGDSNVLSASLGNTLSDPEELQTWFLLFPTKNHWKNNSTLESIEEGLKWFCENYKRHNVKSIAFPALGCGNGNLSWHEVGPLMCEYLSQLPIQVSIYLPAESQMKSEWVKKEFLLPDF